MKRTHEEAFDFTVSCGPTEVTRIGDSNFRAIEFLLPLPRLDDVRQAHLEYVREGRVSFYAQLLETPPNYSFDLLDRRYWVYPTYTVALCQAEKKVYKLYVELDDDAEHVVGDMVLAWFNVHYEHRFRGLRYFPPDVNPTLYGVKVDAKLVPQRTPMWFKLRGEVTGTKAYILLGFWVPTVEEDPTWTIDAKRILTAFQLARMRLGSSCEDPSLIAYMDHNPLSSIQLVGWCTCGTPFPFGWGSSPDALVTDPRMTWENLRDIVGDWTPEELSEFDPTLGVIEIKTSRSFSAYFLPQVYMEMISTKRLWTDLILFSSSTPDGAHASARIYRIYRRKPLELALVKLLKYALARQNELQTVVREEPFCKMRGLLTEMAARIPYTEMRISTETRAKFLSYARCKAELSQKV
jgi:hypothetical protein